MASKWKFVFGTLSLIFILALGGGAYWYGWVSNDPEARAAHEVREIIEAVARHMVLPEGEEPTVATVSDLGKLSSQLFFANAKVGYKVLIYTKAGKAILYDPGSDKIVESAPLSVDISSQ